MRKLKMFLGILFGLIVFVSISGFVYQYDLDEVTRNALLANMNQSHTCSSMYWEGESFAGETSDTSVNTTGHGPSSRGQ